MNELAICGIDELESIGKHFSCIISIWDASHGYDAGSEAIKGHFPLAERLVCIFDDITDRHDGVAPAKEDVHRALAFAKDADSILIHCRAGISRSSAIAFSVLCQSSGPGSESECLQEIQRIRPQALPNRLIVQLADSILERNGAMIRENEKLRLERYMNGWSDADLVA